LLKRELNERSGIKKEGATIVAPFIFNIPDSGKY
jgi:hypothetical protein